MGNKVKIKGIAVREGISKNKRKYIGKELEKFAPSLVGRPILKDHNGVTDNVIGKLTSAEYDSNDKTVPYEGWIKDDGTDLVDKIKDGRISEVSIGAIAGKTVKENKDDDYLVPVDMRALELSTTPVPGVDGTSLGFGDNNENLKEEDIKKIIKDYELEEREWTTQYINNLSDSSFAVIEPAYKKGETENKNARHLPFKSADGEIDLPHYRNALARVNQIEPITNSINASELRSKAKNELEKHKDVLKTSNNESYSQNSENINERRTKMESEKQTENAQSQTSETTQNQVSQEEFSKVKDQMEKLQKEKKELEEQRRKDAIAKYNEKVKAKSLKSKDLSEASMEKIQFAIEMVDDLPEPKSEDEEDNKDEKDSEESKKSKESSKESKDVKEDEKQTAEPKSKESDSEESSNEDEKKDECVVTQEDVSKGYAFFKYY